MAAAVPLSPIIVIEPYNFEDIYIYNSICDYVKTGISTLMCPKTVEVAGNTKRRRIESQNLKPKELIITELSPVNKDEYMAQNSQPNEFTRSDTQIMAGDVIKRIDSSSFSKFLRGQDTTPLATIKDVNRQVILELQSLKETGEGKNSQSESSDEDEQHTSILTAHQISIQGRPTTVIKTDYVYPAELTNCSFIIKPRNLLNYIEYDGRNLVVLPIPDDRTGKQIIFNSQGKWCPNGGVGPGYPSCKTCPFYQSTGRSNETNFPSMWFPFFRIKTSIPGQPKSIATQERGWIYKAWGLQSVTQLRTRLNKKFHQKIPLPDPKNQITSDYLYCFLEKFSHWWQIQLSLQLPVNQEALSSLPEIFKNFIDIVKDYDYDHFGVNNFFIPREESKKIRQLYNLDGRACHTFTKSQIIPNGDTITIDNTPDYINMWLRGGPGGQNTLCVEDADDH